MDVSTARAWVRRWDHQQERYIADREERFTVVCDVVAHVADRITGSPVPLVLDLGCGPGSMSARLAARLPKATIVGLDQDPVLLALGRACHQELIRFVDVDVATPGWSTGLELLGPVDAVVSTTALHWIPEDRLPGLYAEAAGLLRPGGVLVNADNLYDEQPTVAEIAAAVLDARAGRVGVAQNEDWATWWAEVTADPELAGAVAERERRGARGGLTELSAARHADLLRGAGFREVGPVWQSGNDMVLVAVR